MKLRYTIESISENGSRDIVSRDYEGDEILLGRGPACDILLESRSVSLKHARVRASQNALMIEDLASLGGVYVNRRPITQQKIGIGDVVKLGDITLRVARTIDSSGAESWELIERRSPEDRMGLEEKISNNVAALQLHRALPSAWKISVLLVLFSFAGFYVYPFVSPDKLQWSSGPLTDAHRMVAHDCSACHDGGFVQVRDQKCLSCHNMTQHSEDFAAHIGVEPRCAECHMDHTGDHGIIVSQPQLCTACHADIGATLARLGKPKTDVSALNVTGFKNHPQFRVTLKFDAGLTGLTKTGADSAVQSAKKDAEAVQIRRVGIDDSANLRDPSHIKLNHKVHLEPGLRSKTGKKNLDCQYCHKISPDFRTMEPIDFEKHCTDCHGLEFDERLAGLEVPHGNADVVYRFLYAEYAKLLLADDSSLTKRTFQSRGGRLPGKAAPQVIEEQRSREDFSRAFVERESRTTERMLFTKTACYLCHDVSERPQSEAELGEAAMSKFAVLKPNIPKVWMPAAIFGHGAHEEIKCEECHGGVRDSQKTADVLLPRLENCQNCHAQHPAPGNASGDCITCHTYHDSLDLPSSRKREIRSILADLKLD